MDPATIAARIQQGTPEAPSGPMTLEIYPTLACNLSCQFCDTTDRHRPPVNELSLERWLEIVDEAAEMGVARVFVLGGGEPLLRPDIATILTRIKARGLEGILTTNGTLLNPKLGGLMMDIGWDEIHFSLDGACPATHDSLRGVRGAFQRTVKAACRVAVQRRRIQGAVPRIAVHFVLTNQNYQELSDVVRLAHALGAFRVDFDVLIAYHPEQRALMLTPEQRARVPKLAEEAIKVAKSLGVATTLENFTHSDRLERGNAPINTAPTSGEGLHAAPCLKAWHYLVVQADGRTSPCCVLSGQGGDVSSGSLTELWRSDKFLNDVRAGMLSGQPLPRCSECSWNILSHEDAIRRQLT